ncbi:MAG: methylmalonyl Co-A mutase-associated GTPase MeaB [Flavobacteriaceae bacterium CG_4_8_14_3_um_filter_34_10]|nr:methylmalonyl Co-A mutase-associated GTPase MeaB [Flavobacteriia bacterium]PIX09018.1 MAG: methylmalonyl Co-A mutase-associated GTPase MeaB [Flavobacteriaceae bacterium CG_4_8_14_3_um_filter_34_10]
MGTKKNTTSALQEKEGVAHLQHVNSKSAEFIKVQRKKIQSNDRLVKALLSGDKTALSRAITLVESTTQKHRLQAQKIITACLPYANNSIRIGITGVPGVGKSTFIESFGSLLVAKGKKVAVLAVDPSSTISCGSILGDKTRMEELVKEENVFIRPSASGTSLGGVARKTRESIILCEAAGFDTVLIETVGVGQSETAVHSMTDFFLLLKLAGAGDELQGIKRGIMEMADAIVINKADGENVKAANQAKVEFNRALHLFPAKESGWTPKTAVCSALKKEGIGVVWQIIEEYLALTKTNNFFEMERKAQNKFWLLQTIDEQLKSDFYNHPKIKEALKKQLKAIENNETTPFAAAKKLFQIKK